MNLLKLIYDTIYSYMLNRATYEGHEQDLADSKSRRARIEELKNGGPVRRTDSMKSCECDVKAFMRCETGASND